MSLALVQSRSVSGIRAYSVMIEVHLSPGFPGLGIVGLPETAVKESRHRVRSAIINSGFEYPTKRITINLAPADMPKEGGGFDLPIAIGILVASGQVTTDALSRYEFVGELALSGALQAVRGVLPLAKAVHDDSHALVLPVMNAAEAALVTGFSIFAAPSLTDVVNHLNGVSLLSEVVLAADSVRSMSPLCMSDIKGQEHAKRVIEIAAAGGHHVIACGPPGSGKTMLAHRLPGILPSMAQDQALDVASVYSVSHAGFQQKQWKVRPFRSPHHTVSAIALVGGGRVPYPGEMSLAHHGVLFLDEFPEFPRHVLEVLREPLESREAHVSRVAGSAIFPAAFQLVAAMNPCPCGYLGDQERPCTCTRDQVQRYRARLSGPILDRIDLQVFIGRVPTKQLLAVEQQPVETSAVIRERVEVAYQKQYERAGKSNAFLTPNEVQRYCTLTEANRKLLEMAIDRLSLSVRAVHRVLKVARTIADLVACQGIATEHLSEALNYRLDAE